MKIAMNNVNMTALGGERLISGPTPKMREYPEGYFMKKSPLAKDYVAPEKNLIIRAAKFLAKMFVKNK